MHRRITLKRAAALTLVPVATALALMTAFRQDTGGRRALPAPTLLAHDDVADAVNDRAALAAAARSTKRYALPRFGLSRDGTSTRAAAGDPTFGQPTISGIQGVGFEQDIRYDTQRDRIWTSVPGALSSDDSWIWLSKDGGKTFKFAPGSQPKVGKPVSCAGGGDTELETDPMGRLYFIDLTLANFSVARSDDGGNSFPCTNIGVPIAPVDRQWYALDGDPVAGTGNLYLASNHFGGGTPTGGECNATITSNNQLALFRSIQGAGAGLNFGPPNRVSGPCSEQIMGNVEVSPVATTTGEVGQPALTQAVKHVYIVHPNAYLTKIYVARCFPVTVGPPVANTSDPSGVRCNDLPVATLGPNTGPRLTGANFPSLAIDKAGNLYVVWQERPDVNGNTALKYSYSTNEGAAWSAPITIPTPGLLNNTYTWAAAGDDGRVDLMWVGTPAPVGANPTCATNKGPDSVLGPWGAYFTQTLNGHDAAPTFTTPVLASQIPIHKLGQYTVEGSQCGSRLLGDFFQLRIGPQGEANLVYATSAQTHSTHAMFVRQNGGNGVYADKTVSGDPILLGSATDPSGDGKYQLNGMDDANKPNLDILESSLTKPADSACHPAGTPCYRVTMKLNNLTLAPPAQDPVIEWMTQWFVPSDPACVSTNAHCTRGGRNAFVYAESVNGGAIQCYYGESHVQRVGGGVSRTYPGYNAITAPGACTAVTGVNGTITIEVPVSGVSLAAGVAPLGTTLYIVTASTLSVPGPGNSVPEENLPQLGIVGGIPPDVIDVVRAYNANPATTRVTVAALAAARTSKGIAITWRTGSEATVAGFNVWRLEPNGKARKLNRALLRARKSGRVAGASYRFVDRTARRGSHAYRLQIVDLNGTARFYARNVSVRR